MGLIMIIIIIIIGQWWLSVFYITAQTARNSSLCVILHDSVTLY